MQAFKSFDSAAATLAGIEVAHMIRKGQSDLPGLSGFSQYVELVERLRPVAANITLQAKFATLPDSDVRRALVR